ncbi:hypothetical protein A3F06_02030 [candidate division TM6 bacterium RIFCSPHIGHO2_12_FULL_36_22]|nr:MAG: hypothetical protein A3F06_02030 [candidate division TM6 bacterium RIFCSPHIGHO2_12_FULL_36_22]
MTKISAEQAYWKATARNAAEFLVLMKERFPFTIESIQVDGGSEFMCEFERACAREEIPLFVLPRRSPKRNGCIERSNRTVKAEFYSQYMGPISLDDFNGALSKYSDFYNKIRLPPWQSYIQMSSEVH